MEELIQTLERGDQLDPTQTKAVLSILRGANVAQNLAGAALDYEGCFVTIKAHKDDNEDDGVISIAVANAYPEPEFVAELEALIDKYSA